MHEHVITDADGCELDEHRYEPYVGLAARVGEYGSPKEVREALVEAVAGEQQVALEEVDERVQGHRGGRRFCRQVLLGDHHVGYLVRESRLILIDDSLISHLRQIKMRNVQVEYLDIEVPTLGGLLEGPFHLPLHHFVIRGEEHVEELD